MIKTPEVDLGASCPTGCGGRLDLPPPENCSCFIAPPCGSCTDRELTCTKCGWTPSDGLDEPQPPAKPASEVERFRRFFSTNPLF